MKYKTTAKLVIQACDKDLPGVFGHGCVLLLQGIAREHSLNRAAKSMGMAYSKAWRIVNEAEGQLGCKLIERDGARGSTLTPAGERAIEVYETLQSEINNVITTKANDLIASIKKQLIWDGAFLAAQPLLISCGEIGTVYADKAVNQSLFHRNLWS